MKRLTSIRLPEITDRQLTELASVTGLNTTELITLAINNLYREEIKTMTAPAKELIRNMLVRILGWTEGDANAAIIERKQGDSGYGWYVKRFGDHTQGTYWGPSVAEVSTAMDDEVTARQEIM